MIECYYMWCEHHALDEPFCTKDKCQDSKEQVARFQYFRDIEMENRDEQSK